MITFRTPQTQQSLNTSRLTRCICCKFCTALPLQNLNLAGLHVVPNLAQVLGSAENLGGVRDIRNTYAESPTADTTPPRKRRSAEPISRRSPHTNASPFRASPKHPVGLYPDARIRARDVVGVRIRDSFRRRLGIFDVASFDLPRIDTVRSDRHGGEVESGLFKVRPWATVGLQSARVHC